MLTLKSSHQQNTAIIAHSMQNEISAQASQLHSIQSENEKLLSQINATKAYLELKSELYI